MATQEQVEAAVTRILVALNACEGLELDWQAIIDWRQAQPGVGQITEDDMRAFASSLIS